MGSFFIVNDKLERKADDSAIGAKVLITTKRRESEMDRRIHELAERVRREDYCGEVIVRYVEPWSLKAKP